MNDISHLIKEAKPLYFARKRRNNQIKGILCMLICIFGLSFLHPQPAIYNYDGLESELSMTESGSVIEELGLPTDDCGLLMVG